MQAPVAKICAILRAISFFKRMKHFLENLETPTQAQTTSRHPLTATKDEKEYRTRLNTPFLSPHSQRACGVVGVF